MNKLCKHMKKYAFMPFPISDVKIDFLEHIFFSALLRQLCSHSLNPESILKTADGREAFSHLLTPVKLIFYPFIALYSQLLPCHDLILYLVVYSFH